MMKICMVRLGKVMQLTNRTTIIYSIIAASQKGAFCYEAL